MRGRPFKTICSIAMIVTCFIFFHSFGKSEADNLSPEIKALVGTKYIYPQSLKIIDKYGYPETLSGTNNSRWVAYFPEGDFTIISNKQTGIIRKVISGRRPQ
jgi:hypothetical protein